MAKNGYVQAREMIDRCYGLMGMSQIDGNVNACKIVNVGSRGWTVSSSIPSYANARNNGILIEIRHYGVSMFKVLHFKERGKNRYKSYFVDLKNDRSWSDRCTSNRIREIIQFDGKTCREI